MTVRERLEAQEDALLSPLAARSRDAKRSHPMEECPFRTKFQRDRDRILHSKSFRRLKHKTQVYIVAGDHYRTRMTHSLEVAQISRTIARGLMLNEDLTEAIALGHDVGHTPFGHAGEAVVEEITGHFAHNEQSLRMVEVLERGGHGLNLTGAVRDGILNHTGKGMPTTFEGRIVRIADRIAYLCHDYDDAENMGLISAKELPDRVRRVLGTTHSSMITAMVQNLVENSMDEDTIHMDKEGDEVLLEFRSFMFDQVYMSQPLIPDRKRGHGVVVMLYEWYMSHPDELPEKQKKLAQGNISLAARDYISGLTDNFAINLFKEKYMPKYWNL